ncbi:MAG: JAB domain-containing protein [Gemmatimonadota bacterium]
MEAIERLTVWRCKLVREDGPAVGPSRIGGPEDVYRIVSAYLGDVDREHFVALLLDAAHQVRGVHTVTVGVLDGSVIHPREVFKPAILASSAAVIIAHNHPSGHPDPSAEDRQVTRQLVEAGEIIGIPVLDHVIIGDGRYSSAVEGGWMGAS